jgi:hypothetical protein
VNRLLSGLWRVLSGLLLLLIIIGLSTLSWHLVGAELTKNLFGLAVALGFLSGVFKPPPHLTPSQRRVTQAVCLFAAVAAASVSVAGMVNGTVYWRR